MASALQTTDVFRAELARHRERVATHGRRGWLMRRALVGADAFGIALAFALSSTVFDATTSDRIHPSGEVFLFLLTFPMWLLLAKLQGLYERDEERADHSTVDEFTGVLLVVTLGTWLFQALSWMTGLASPQLGRLVGFWLLAIGLVTTGRAVARVRSHGDRRVRHAHRRRRRGRDRPARRPQDRSASRVRDRPARLRRRGAAGAAARDARTSPMLGGLDDLQSLVPSSEIDRVIVAFSGEPDDRDDGRSCGRSATATSSSTSCRASSSSSGRGPTCTARGSAARRRPAGAAVAVVAHHEARSRHRRRHRRPRC